jgi:hypothetical protein
MPGRKDMNGRVEIIGASTAMTLEHAQALIVAQARWQLRRVSSLIDEASAGPPLTFAPVEASGPRLESIG